MKGKPTNNDNDDTKEDEESNIEDENDNAESPSENVSAIDRSGAAEANVITSSSASSKSIILSSSPSSSSSSQSPSSAGTNIIDDQWIPKPRDRSEVTRGIIFACEIVERNETNTLSSVASSENLIRIRIRGQSFLLHQVLFEHTILMTSHCCTIVLQ